MVQRAVSVYRIVQIVRAHRRLATSFAIVLSALLGGSGLVVLAASSALAEGLDRSADGERIPTDELAIGPGKVRFVQTRNGAWREIVPAWTGGSSLIAGGGFAVFAENVDGQLVEVVATGDATLDVPESARDLGRCCEGIQHGCRAPSLDPDDDGDGRANEDRLDGIDNDNDGSVDEDFAAIGDEMIVTAYVARAGEAGAALVALDFHQETYAWSLPNINGAIMLRFEVSNTGGLPLRNLRVAAYYERAGTFSVGEKEVVAASGRGNDPKSGSSVAVVSGGGGGTDLALVGFPPDGTANSHWISGWAGSRQEMERSVARAVAAAGEGEQLDLDERVTGGGIVFHISPPTDRLEPGRSLDVNLAIITAARPGQINDLAAHAVETYLGDGANRYIPPPVAMKPRVLWARYRPDASEAGTVLIDIQDGGDDPVGPENISHFTGVAPSEMEPRRVPTGGSVLTLRGDTAEGILMNEGRVKLKGRLDTGEFFEMILRPEVPSAPEPSREADAYWKTPGKLARELLTGSPNPFRNSTTITYEVPSLIEQADGSILQSSGARATTVKIYNVSGRLVSILVEESLSPGRYSIDWAAVDESGNAVASGVYYVRLRIEKRSTTHRLILLK
jgi:hypothetical protein